jgi:hypothetical protein
MTAPEAADYLGFTVRCQDPVRAFRQWVRRYGVASARRGRVLLFDRHDLDEAVGASGRRRTRR